MSLGYHDCPCRDCFEIAIGEDEAGNPSLCNDCQEAGCEGGDCECQSPYAYDCPGIQCEEDDIVVACETGD